MAKVNPRQPKQVTSRQVWHPGHREAPRALPPPFWVEGGVSSPLADSGLRGVSGVQRLRWAEVLTAGLPTGRSRMS